MLSIGPNRSKFVQPFLDARLILAVAAVTVIYIPLFRHVYSLCRYIVFYYYLITADSLPCTRAGCALLFVLGGFIPEHNKFPPLSPSPILPPALSLPPLFLSLFLSPFTTRCRAQTQAMQRDTGCESYITTTGRLLPLASCATCMET